MSEESYDDSALSDLPLWADSEANKKLSLVCEMHNVPIEVIAELVSLQRERQHQERAAGIYARIEEILGMMD